MQKLKAHNENESHLLAVWWLVKEESRREIILFTFLPRMNKFLWL